MKKLYVGSLSDGDTNPNDWVKSIYLPFHKKWTRQGSVTWKIFYFYGRTSGIKRASKGSPRVYESYGRTEAEAKLGLERARVRGKNLVPISKKKFLEMKAERNKYKNKLKVNHAY